MKKYILAVSFCLPLMACKNGAPPPILQPLADVGCAVEQSMTNMLGSAVAQQCNGNAAACGPAFQVALGNVNLCNLPIPAAPAPAAQAILSAHPEWKKIGDIPGDALKGASGQALKAEAVKALGIIGSVVCPIVVPAALGFLSPAIPAACACTQSLSASAFAAAATAGCETLMAPLH